MNCIPGGAGHPLNIHRISTHPIHVQSISTSIGYLMDIHWISIWISIWISSEASKSYGGPVKEEADGGAIGRVRNLRQFLLQSSSPKRRRQNQTKRRLLLFRWNNFLRLPLRMPSPLPSLCLFRRRFPHQHRKRKYRHPE